MTSIILVTSVFDLRVILWGKIRSQSPSGVKVLNTFFEQKQLSGTEKASTWYNEKHKLTYSCDNRKLTSESMHLQATRHCTPYPQRWSTTWTGRGPEGTQPSDAPEEWDSLCCPARQESTVGTWSLRCCPIMNKEPPSVWKINLFEGKYYIGKANTVKKKRSCDSFYRSLSYSLSIKRLNSIATLPERDSSTKQVNPWQISPKVFQ